MLDEDLRLIAMKLFSNMPAQFLMDIYLNIISILVLFVYDIENVWIILPMGTVLMAAAQHAAGVRFCAVPDPDRLQAFLQ